MNFRERAQRAENMLMYPALGSSQYGIRCTDPAITSRTLPDSEYLVVVSPALNNGSQVAPRRVAEYCQVHQTKDGGHL